MNIFNPWRKFLLQEAGFNRIINILQGGVASVNTVGFLTGENPMAQKLSSAENRELNKELMAWMRDRGYGPIRIRGKFGNKERSMMIPNISREDMVERSTSRRLLSEHVINKAIPSSRQEIFSQVTGTLELLPGTTPKKRIGVQE